MIQPSDTILSAQNITLRYRTRSGMFKKFEHTALDCISFDLKKGETLGVLGRNGSGKSTLLKILGGIISPTRGKVICDGNATRALLALGLGFSPDLSGRNNAMLSVMLQGMSKRKAAAAIEEIKQFSELGEFFEQPVKTYSAGMRARLGFATSIKSKVDILLIDEVLSVGDAMFKKKAEETMLKKLEGNQTNVFVSHSHEQVKLLCDRAMWLEGGKIQAIGETEEVVEKYHSFVKNS